ncbi:MAG: tetratricopeptide repeat protein [Bacteroidales bacterium]|nr:tetratricopeptide repeat protein [Bacteroidales bacterium]
MLIAGFHSNSQNSTIDSLKQNLANVSGEDKVRTLIGLSYNYLRISADSSLYYSNRALDYSTQSGNERGVARALLMVGSGYNAKGEYSQAIQTQLRALEIFKSIRDSAAIGITYNNLGTNYHQMGNYNEAIIQYQNSIEIAKKMDNNFALYFATNNIGTIYEEWNKLDLCIEYYQTALSIAKELTDSNSICISLQNLGVAYRKLGNYEEALSNLKESLIISRKIGNTAEIYNTFINRGEIYLKLNDTDSALENFKLAYEESENNNSGNIAEASLKLGQTYTLLKDYSSARVFLESSLKIAGELEDAALLREIHLAFSDYYSQIKNFEKAYISYLEYTKIKDTIFNRDSRREISEMQTLYELDKKEKEIEIQNLKIEKQQARLYYILSGILILLIMAYLVFNRYKLKQKQARVELEKKNIDIEQRLLRTQMNPHFIFNSLNSINSFISDNNSDSAQSFLSKFARLMRYILENSRKAFVPLEDEINTLQLNMELEQLRFDGKFDFEIEVDKKIDPEFTYIPPMLIQPFIENAILHGLSGKKEKGLLKVGFKINGELMHCSVEDNGVGRKKAMELKAGSAKPHRSLGMQVTKERLEILNEKTTEEVLFQIIDLEDESGNALGTRVELKVPYEKE